MKSLSILFIGIVLSIGTQAQSLIGAWESTSKSEAGVELRNVVIFSEGYQVLTTYEAKTGKFVSCNGGLWKIDGDTVTETVEFDTDNSERVGEQVSFKIFNDGKTMGIVDSKMKFTRIDDGSPGALDGAWLMSGRVRNGEVQSRNTDRPRKTMKILSGKRFQWIAYNTETKQFMGTGGGSYTTINGEYTEKIEFFSRDDNKVGLDLKFNYKLENGDWVHTGFSSKGDPLHEIWSVRKK